MNLHPYAIVTRPIAARLGSVGQDLQKIVPNQNLPVVAAFLDGFDRFRFVHLIGGDVGQDEFLRAGLLRRRADVLESRMGLVVLTLATRAAIRPLTDDGGTGIEEEHVRVVCCGLQGIVARIHYPCHNFGNERRLEQQPS